MRSCVTDWPAGFFFNFAFSKICVLFRKETGVLWAYRVKIVLRKEKDALQPESGLLSGKQGPSLRILTMKRRERL